MHFKDINPMITIYKTRLTINNKSNDIISRLIWKTKLVDSLLFAKTSSYESNTIRPFVGQLDEKKEILCVKRVRPLFLNIYSPQVTAQIDQNSILSENCLILKFKLGIYTTIFFAALLFSFLLGLFMIMEQSNIESVIEYFIIAFFISAILYGITIFEIRATRNKIDEIINSV